jgi:Zn-dependent protease
MIELLFGLCILLFSVILHEVAHGYVAERCGDPTARYYGRISLDPRVHIDPIGSIFLPLLLILFRAPVLFGWAKPVPINPYNFRNPREDIVWVALAGPCTNFILAIGFAFLYHLLNLFAPIFFISMILKTGVFINLVLGVFNFIPIPPLDGSRVVKFILPPRWEYSYERLEPYGIIFIFVLLSFGLLQYIILPAVTTLGNLLGISLF